MSLSRPLMQCPSLLGTMVWPPQSDTTWITKDEFHELNPVVLEGYLQENSPSSFLARECDANRYHRKFYCRRNRKFENVGIFI